VPDAEQEPKKAKSAKAAKAKPKAKPKADPVAKGPEVAGGSGGEVSTSPPAPAGGASSPAGGASSSCGCVPVDKPAPVSGPTGGALTYAQAGVDIDAGEEAVRLIKDDVESTRIPGVMGALGGFAALYEMPTNMTNPVLVTSTDGVGTKLVMAQEAGKLANIGVDLVAMCVNDVLTVGASPILFLDYLATGRLVPQEAAEVVAGIAKGCREAGCALVGGEMAEMPGVYQPQAMDLAGFCVGLAEKDQLIDGSKVEPTDIVIGLGSSGVHANGFSLVRRILEDNQCCLDDKFPHFGESMSHILLQPTRIYVNAIWDLLERGIPVHAMAHVTGGGIAGNLARVLPEGVSAQLHFENWKVPKLFKAIQELGEIEDREMFRTFNMGIGYVVVVPFASAEFAARTLLRAGEEPLYIGAIAKGGKQRVSLEGIT